MAKSVPAFIADCVGLDFLNSIATMAEPPHDWLASGTSLLGWIELAGLVPPRTLKSLRMAHTISEFTIVAAEARELREWFRGVVRKCLGRSMNAQDLPILNPLNLIFHRNRRNLEIVNATGPETGLALRSTWTLDTPHCLLAPIAEALAHLTCEADFTCIKACEGAGCPFIFLDHTRGHARRWCSMANCGNRAKQAAHRHRHRRTR
jgi:predicted RNA-binding Zn ribbon-like protein